MLNKITKGFICYSEEGKLGLVTSENKVKTKGNEIVYKGIHLQNPNFGKTWVSKEPHIVGFFDLNNGNIKFPGKVKPIILPNATLIKVLRPIDYGIKLEDPEEDQTN